jgi:hypothetical protein
LPRVLLLLTTLHPIPLVLSLLCSLSVLLSCQPPALCGRQYPCLDV